MRAKSILPLTALLVMLVPASIPAEPDLPDTGPWTAHYKGIAYEVVDGSVRRLDGARPDPEAAREVLKAHRVHGMVASRPELVDRLSDREADPEADLRLSYAQGAKAKLAIVAQALAAAPAQSLLGDALGQLPVRPVDVASDATIVRNTLDDGLPAARSVRDVSLVARGVIHAFDASHAVEDKAFLIDSFLQAAPAYGTAAGQADAVRARAQRALESAYALRDGLEGQSLSALDEATGSHIASELRGAIADLELTVAVSQEQADALRADAAFMQSVANEAAKPISPLLWAVLGGAGIVAAGLTSFGWLRRRAGLP